MGRFKTIKLNKDQKFPLRDSSSIDLIYVLEGKLSVSLRKLQSEEENNEPDLKEVSIGYKEYFDFDKKNQLCRQTHELAGIYCVTRSCKLAVVDHSVYFKFTKVSLFCFSQLLKCLNAKMLF